MTDSPHYARLRRQMVEEQIMVRHVRDPRVLDAMRAVPRHLFIPEGQLSEAYNDYPLPIGMGQTISQPYIVAQMTELLELKGDERVLEVGTGCGYQAAVLSLLAREVYTTEIIESLALEATERLARLGYSNVHARHSDGSQGWPEVAPFDAIIITAAAPRVPEALAAQLKDQGRLVIPIGEEGATQTLTLCQKQDKSMVATELEFVLFVPMRGAVQNAT
jgi:protein-L-isoaspartate(D-aspartate) O-methyltransferase